MNKIIVKKIKTNELTETLRNLQVGDEAHIKESEFRVMSVYSCCYRLRKEGYKLTCSAKKNIDGCIVTRLG